jgi:Na+/phosphate symporter
LTKADLIAHTALFAEAGQSMARKSKATFQKREKEKARQQRQKEKEQRRIESKLRRAEVGPRIEGEDPDIAGIRPGPQPLPEVWNYDKPTN